MATATTLPTGIRTSQAIVGVNNYVCLPQFAQQRSLVSGALDASPSPSPVAPATLGQASVSGSGCAEISNKAALLIVRS